MAPNTPPPRVERTLATGRTHIRRWASTLRPLLVLSREYSWRYRGLARRLREHVCPDYVEHPDWLLLTHPTLARAQTNEE